MKKLKNSSNEVKLPFSRFNNCNFQIWRDSSEVKNYLTTVCNSSPRESIPYDLREHCMHIQAAQTPIHIQI